jgi:hypothetical protein
VLIPLAAVRGVRRVPSAGAIDRREGASENAPIVRVGAIRLTKGAEMIRNPRAIGACAAALAAGAAPCAVAIAARPTAGATYRATSHHKSESLSVSAGRRSIAAYNLNVSEKCTRVKRLGNAHARRSGGRGAPPIVITSTGGFSIDYVASGSYRQGSIDHAGRFEFTLNGRFESGKSAQATLRITFRASKGGFRCDSGQFRFTARS